MAGNSYGTTSGTTLGNCQGATNASFTLVGTIDVTGGTGTPPHECLIQLQNFTGATAGTASKACDLYVLPSFDNTTFADVPTASNLQNPVYVGSVYQSTTGDTSPHSSRPFALSPLFGAALPRYLKVYVYNGWGCTLSATNNLVVYQTETFG